MVHQRAARDEPLDHIMRLRAPKETCVGSLIVRSRTTARSRRIALLHGSKALQARDGSLLVPLASAASAGAKSDTRGMLYKCINV
jgi:hypothetical protein